MNEIKVDKNVAALKLIEILLEKGMIIGGMLNEHSSK